MGEACGNPKVSLNFVPTYSGYSIHEGTEWWTEDHMCPKCKLEVFYSDGTFEVDVPAGLTEITLERGFEWGIVRAPFKKSNQFDRRLRMSF